jgi:2-C-methyl-D-erythritol 4-phosphate cytidylyltransferase
MSPTSPTVSQPDVGVVIPAAGRGDRAGAGDLKQFRPIRGVPMLLRSIRPFAQHPRVHQVAVALPAEDMERPPAWLAGLAGARLRLVAGGATRMASVRAALAALDPACRIVLVHDAARPFVSRETIDAVILGAEAGQGALAALPVSDTIKRGDAGRRVRETVDRRDLWRAQTPQAFPRNMLEAAYGQAGDGGDTAPTDDAQLVERAGFPVILVPDSSSNIKVTTPEDFRLAEALAEP